MQHLTAESFVSTMHTLLTSHSPEVEEFMRSTPVISLALRGENAIAKIRELAGPTNSQKAAKAPSVVTSVKTLCETLFTHLILQKQRRLNLSVSSPRVKYSPKKR